MKMPRSHKAPTSNSKEGVKGPARVRWVDDASLGGLGNSHFRFNREGRSLIPISFVQGYVKLTLFSIPTDGQ